VAAVDAAGIEVQDPRTGQVTVTFTPTTAFTRTVGASAADLAAGDCVIAMGAPPSSGGSLSARSVQISPPAANGGCAAGGRGGPRAGGRPGGATPRNRPPGTIGQRRTAAAAGKITSVGAGSFVVEGGPANTPRTVTITPATTFSKVVGADHTALAVGQCVTALGPADDTGAVAASAISIRQPGPAGCTGGFGGPGGGRQGGGGQGVNHA
jgi:hypothetical protein